MVAIYDPLAEEYDSMYRSPLHRAEDTILRQYLVKYGFFGEQAGSLLDLGCGTGGYLDLLAEDHKTPPEYVGLDISPRMLAVAKRKHPNATWVCADMAQIGQWQPKSFNTIIALFGSISYSANMDWMIQNIAKLIRPGGQFLVMAMGERYINRPSYILNRKGIDAPARMVSNMELSLMLPRDGWHCRTFGFSGFAEQLADKISQHSLERYLRWEMAWLGTFLPDTCYWLCAHGIKNKEE